MTDYIKRIQSRLSRQGIKLEKPTLREELQILGYSNETLTSELSDLATEKLLDKFKVVEQLIVSENLLEPIPQLEISENLVNEPGGIKEPLNQQAENPEELGQLAVAEVGSMVMSKSDKVASTAESMGIELQLNEVTNIASNLDYSGDSLDEGINDIRSAIIAFVEYKAQINQQKINHMIGEVRATVNQRNQETSQRLNNGLSQIAKDINQGDTDFKSTVRQALKCFAIPAKKAG